MTDNKQQDVDLAQTFNESCLDFTQPHYRKIGTTEWLNKQAFEKLLVSLQHELQVLQGFTETSHQVSSKDSVKSC